MKPLIIFGTGELADLAHYYFSQSGREVTAFTVDAKYLNSEFRHGLRVLAFEEVQNLFPPQTHEMFVAIGSSEVNRARAAKCAEARSKGYALATYISPESIVRTDQIGDNCIIMDHNNIHPFVRIGNNVIFSNANHIGHHSVIEDNCFITSNVVVSGGVTVGEGSFLGVNASLRDHIKIGKYNLIGAGAMILSDTKDFEVFSVEATPARRVSSDRIHKL